MWVPNQRDNNIDIRSPPSLLYYFRIDILAIARISLNDTKGINGFSKNSLISMVL